MGGCLARVVALVVCSCLALSLIGPGRWSGSSLLLLNCSASLPTGLYLRVGGAGDAQVGSLVDFSVPSGPAYDYVVSRLRRVEPTWHILKPVVAAHKDVVRMTDEGLCVNGHWVAPAVVGRDRLGNPVPSWRGERELGPSEVFVLSTRIHNSFDSRCYGPVRLSQVSGVYKPLWVVDGDRD